jgi:hypothetical protein
MTPTPKCFWRSYWEENIEVPTPAMRLLARSAFLFSLLMSGATVLMAQETSNEGWPQVDTYVKLNSDFQALATVTEHVASDSKDTDFRIGPTLFYHVPALFHGEVLRHHYEENRFLSLGAGYLYITPGPGGTGSVEQRGILQLTPRLPLPRKLLLVDRNQADLRWISKSFYWRYRNQLTLQRNFSIHKYSFTSYAQGELQYYSKYGTWYRTTYSAGARLQVGKVVEFEPYYEHENTSQGKPAHVNAVGLILSLFFRD